MSDLADLESLLTWMTSHSVVVRTKQVDREDHVRVAMDVNVDTVVVVKATRQPGQGPLDHLLAALEQAAQESASVGRRLALTVVPGGV